MHLSTRTTRWEEATMSGIDRMKELAYRANDRIEVSLLWRPAVGRLSVVVDDLKADESFALEARPDNALDVFYHPYAYASRSERAFAAETTFPFCS
jgi:hypothetical protein